MQNLKDTLASQRQQGLYRQRYCVDSREGNTIIVDGKSYTNFSSNDYLGLANDPRLIAAFKEGADHYGVGSSASQLITGYSKAHQACEERLADFLGYPRAILFATGYMANVGTISALASRSNQLLLDRRCHASLIDAAILSRANTSRYHTNDIDTLAEKMTDNSILISDSVFSMDGDIAPLQQLSSLSKEHSSYLYVDDAHGFGVLGKAGKGCLEHCELDNKDVDIYVGTLGKACGTAGAFVCGNEELIETLIQKARSLHYSTAAPPAIAHATLTSLDIIENETWRREHIANLIKRFRQGAKQLGLQLTESETPIQAVILGDNQATLTASERLKSQGYYVTAIRPPTVSKGTSRLRITLCANHSEDQVDQLISALGEALSS